MQLQAVVERNDELEEGARSLRADRRWAQVNEVGLERCEEVIGDVVVPAHAKSGQRRASAVGVDRIVIADSASTAE